MSSVFDKEQDITNCDIGKILPDITSKWVAPIVYYLSFGSLRFSELKRRLPKMADSNLSKILRNLEEFGMIERHDYKTVPPKVDYSLTETGRRFIPVMKEMEKFGNYYCEKHKL